MQKTPSEGNTMNYKLLLSTCIFSTFAFADNTATCTVLRNANAHITVNKESWVQDSAGNWAKKETEIANSDAIVQVYDANNISGCEFEKNIHLDSIVINGSAEAINVYAIEEVYSAPTPHKIFTASYWISANGGSSAWAAARTQDLTLQNIAVDVGSEHQNTAAEPHQERIIVSANFTDTNAQ